MPNNLINSDYHGGESKFIGFAKVPVVIKRIAGYPWQVIKTIASNPEIAIMDDYQNPNPGKTYISPSLQSFGDKDRRVRIASKVLPSADGYENVGSSEDTLGVRRTLYLTLKNMVIK